MSAGLSFWTSPTECRRKPSPMISPSRTVRLMSVMPGGLDDLRVLDPQRGRNGGDARALHQHVAGGQDIKRIVHGDDDGGTDENRPAHAAGVSPAQARAISARIASRVTGRGFQ